MPEFISGSSIRAERTPPRKSKGRKQVVDFRGFPLSTEEGNPLTTEKDVYPIEEYGQNFVPSVVVDSESYKTTGISSENNFSKSNPAALPIKEVFQDQSEVSRSLLGVNRTTTQQGLFGNVSTYGLDAKDWRIDSSPERVPDFWYKRRNSTGRYYNTTTLEDTTNSAIALLSNPSPFTLPVKPEVQDQLITSGGGERYRGWGQYLNCLVAQHLIEYMVKNFTPAQRAEYNLDYLLSKYPPIQLPDGSIEFNKLYWDKIWLDINQDRFGSSSNYPIIPFGRAYNFIPTPTNNLVLSPFKSASLWGENSNSNVIIQEAGAALSNNVPCGWDSFFFNSTRIFYPSNEAEDFGHYKLQTNPSPDVWEKYFGLRWEYLRQDLKDWKFTIHESNSTVTQVEKDLKLPYFILDPLIPDPTNKFSSEWPSDAFGTSINLPTSGNRPGGEAGISSEVTIKSLRAFRYQPGRISGFTYGTKVSEIGAGPGTTIEWGVENDTDSYMFRLTNGANFSIVRRSIIPLDNTEFLESSGYPQNTKTIEKNGRVQYETLIEQKNMNGDALNGEGESGYILNLDTVTMYKIEFGWYGAIGARFYAYVPQSNGNCRWVTLHTLVIENQLGQPCLGDPFFYFRYRLQIEDSSSIRVNQFIYKFGASYYIDGYDKGVLYSSYTGSKQRLLKDPLFSESKTSLSAIDWTVLMGIKPKQYLFNRFGSEIYNKKEIFPKSFSVYSQEDCEIKLIRQKACPEFAYSHQEGYTWALLPESRRVKGKFSINSYFTGTDPSLGIDEDDASTHTAIMAYAGPTVGDWKSPTLEANFDTSQGEDIRVVGDDLFNLVSVAQSFGSGTSSFKLNRITEDSVYLSSRDSQLELERIRLPFTYAPVPPYEDGYDVEFDYYRRDQILLSNIDIVNDEFFMFWTSKDFSGLDATHMATLRIGFVWPEMDDTQSPIYQGRSSADWGIELPSSPDAAVSYDGESFYEGLPVDFVKDHFNNTLYIETVASTYSDMFNIEALEGYLEYRDLFSLEPGTGGRLNVQGEEGGICSGVGCKAGRELRENVELVKFEEEISEGVVADVYYLQDSKMPWPSLGESYGVTIEQDGTTVTQLVSDPTTKTIQDATIYLIKVGTTAPAGITLGKITVSYNIIYIALIDKKSAIRSLLVAKIAPGDLPFIRMFIQARQGASLGGVWIGQKTPDGILLDPFTPHRCTLSISDGETLDAHGEFSSPSASNGAIKAIRTITETDSTGVSTVPTFDASEDTLDTHKSIHSNKRKCGSFLSEGGTNAAGILTPTDYPIRWLTDGSSGAPLATYYVAKNQSVEIQLEDIFNIHAESVVNSDDANTATIFIARSLNNHNPEASNKEIYMTLNYDEQ